MQRVSMHAHTMLLCAIRYCHQASISCSPAALSPSCMKQTSRAGHCRQCQTWDGQPGSLLGWRVNCLVLAARWTNMSFITSHGQKGFSLPAGWWQKEDFVINELNVQSVITSPGHDEIIPLTQEKYTVRGYAYSGELACLGS